MTMLDATALEIACRGACAHDCDPDARVYVGTPMAAPYGRGFFLPNEEYVQPAWTMHARAIRDAFEALEREGYSIMRCDDDHA